MKLILKINDAKSARSKDKNGYLIIKNNPIAKAGVFDYLASEIKENGSPDQVVKVFRPFENLETKKDHFAKKPIVLGHEWVGEERDSVQGAIGDVITAKAPYLYADLIIYSPSLIKEIEEGNIVELSPGYDAGLIKEGGIFEGESYEYKQDLINVNHLAVVEEGRSGKDLRLLDSKKTGEKKMDILELLTKAVKRVKDEAPKEEVKTQDEDKRELIREVMAIASKPDSEFTGGENEKIETVAKLLEKLAYKPSEESKSVDADAVEEKKEEVKIEEKPRFSDDEFFKKLEEFIDSKLEAFKQMENRTQDAKAKAYAEVSQVVGAFNTEGLSESQVYAKGYKYLTGRDLDSSIDAKSAFKVKVQDRMPQKIEDSKPAGDGLTDAQREMLARLG